MAEIIPAILPQSYEEITEKLELIAGYAGRVQIDICDGGYVNNRTWPYLKKGDNDQIFQGIIEQETALPHWEDIDFEFDLMVKGASEKIPDFISAGASRIVVHKDSMEEDELTAILGDYSKHSDELGPFDIELGLAVASDTHPDEIASYAPMVYFIQVMGIKHVGFQGQEFDPQAVETVRALHDAYPHLAISVDGGVNLDNAAALIDAGASRLIVGSALFNSDNPLETLQELESL